MDISFNTLTTYEVINRHSAYITTHYTAIIYSQILSWQTLLPRLSYYCGDCGHLVIADHIVIVTAAIPWVAAVHCLSTEFL